MREGPKKDRERIKAKVDDVFRQKLDEYDEQPEK